MSILYFAVCIYLGWIFQFALYSHLLTSMSYHHVFSYKNDPEAEQNFIEYTLSDVREQHHEWQVVDKCQQLHWHCITNKKN